MRSVDSKIEIVPGFEAKILADGSVDCPEKYAQEYFLVASFHTTYGSKETWVSALKKAIQNDAVDVIGHLAPEHSFALAAKEVEEVACLLAENDKIIELNAKYRRPPIDWLRAFKAAGVKFHLASDAHSLMEIGRFEGISDLISAVDNGTGNMSSC